MPILRNISQLAVCKRFTSQHDAGLLSNAALVWQDQDVVWTGKNQDIPHEYLDQEVINCQGKLVTPGLIDCHTHLCFGGWRGDEFQQRLQGASYQQIAAAGGGIISTVAATRAASLGSLMRKSRNFLDQMLALGVTSIECKSGYGLDHANELKQLEVYRRLNQEHAIDLFPTFLGAHVVPAEYSKRRNDYVELLCQQIIPDVATRNLALFCDVFVESGAFTLAEARLILDAAQKAGLGLKVHADQLSDGGGAGLAAEMNAVSAEHLEYVSQTGIEQMADRGVVAVSLPLASLFLREKYLPARQLIDAGVRVAVATDFNPRSSPSYHLPLALTIACLNQEMTPDEALMGSTTIAAQAISRDHRVGALESGMQADISIFDATDLNHWLYHFQGNACVGVIKKGEWVRKTF